MSVQSGGETTAGAGIYQSTGQWTLSQPETFECAEH